MMIFSCLVLVWMFGGQPTEKVEPIPTDGLIEAMQPLSKTLIKSDADETDFVSMDHIAENGEKAVPPQPIPVNKPTKKEIVIFTRRNCPPCDRWKRIEQPKFEKAGWTVAYCDNHNFALTPHFLIEENGKKYENKGYLPFDKIDEVIK
jgi:glutaredoxin